MEYKIYISISPTFVGGGVPDAPFTFCLYGELFRAAPLAPVRVEQICKTPVYMIQ